MPDETPQSSDAAERGTDHLFDDSYTLLRSLAARYFRNERVDHTLQPTALVHEAYIRLSERGHQIDRNRLYFLAAAGRSMRQILVNHAERRNAQKRNGGGRRTSIDAADLIDTRETVDILVLDDALTRLSRDAPRCAQVVELRFFAGLTIDESADIMGVSARTVAFDWRYARARLISEIG